jgi:hypothetical protein
MEESMIEFSNWDKVPSNFTGKAKIISSGDIITRVNGLRHSINDEPSTVDKRGNKYWYKDGKRHRLSGPAIESVYDRNDPDGKLTEWWVEGKPYSKEEFDALPEVIMYRAGLVMFL